MDEDFQPEAKIQPDIWYIRCMCGQLCLTAKAAGDHWASCMESRVDEWELVIFDISDITNPSEAVLA